MKTEICNDTEWLLSREAFIVYFLPRSAMIVL